MIDGILIDNDSWIAGKSLSIADLSLLPSITSLNLIVPMDENVYPKLYAWVKRAESLPWYAANDNGLNKLKVLLNSAFDDSVCCC